VNAINLISSGEIFSRGFVRIRKEERVGSPLHFRTFYTDKQSESQFAIMVIAKLMEGSSFHQPQPDHQGDSNLIPAFSNKRKTP